MLTRLFYKIRSDASCSVEVLATLTSDVGRILSKLHTVQPNGNLNLITGIRIAHVRKTSSTLIFPQVH